MRQCVRRNLEAVRLVFNLYQKKSQLFEEAREMDQDEEEFGHQLMEHLQVRVREVAVQVRVRVRG